MLSITPSLWFADNNCEEAVRYYVEVFPHSAINEITYYPAEDLDEHFEGMTGKVLNASFHLGNQAFIALDGGPYFRFNEAISFTIECKDQDEIDYYWEKLSHVKEAEQCGWVKDKFGLSWQIIPTNMEELLQTDAQMKAMMQMKKIDIEALRNAR